MIAVRLMGGLGNQMFQYAIGRTLANKHHAGLLLDLSYIENQPSNETPREYELDCFNIKAKLTHEAPFTEEQPRRYLVKKRHYEVFWEKGFPYKAEVLKLPNQTLLVGYWQSEKYFKENEKQLRKDFTFINQLPKNKLKILKDIQSCPTSVSLQVRRGDYVSNLNSNKFHGLLGMDYYEKAVRYFIQQIKNPFFYVISDDSEWCKDNIKLGFPTTYVDGHGPGWQDMLLMSQCKHNIIANSSFGWWGSWLNENNEKIIVAPKVWAQDKHADYSDIDPGNWIRV